MSDEAVTDRQSADPSITGVVAGFDGSSTAELAADWAAATAAAYGTRLTLLHARPDFEAEVQEIDVEGDSAAPWGVRPPEGLQQAERRISAQYPELEVRVVIHPESPVNALLAASHSAEVVAVGSRGLEGFRGLVLGSTTMNIVPGARCPVVVLYQPDDATQLAVEQARHPREVVVGYDGSESAQHALAFAARHAEATDLGVAVVIVTNSRSETPVQRVSEDWEDLDESTRALVRSASQVTDTHPRVPVVYHHGTGRPAPLLIEEAAGAPLAVVGARGRGGFTGLLLGSVGMQMLIHAECPVAVVHGPANDDA